MKKRRILLVDDEEGFTRLLKLNLEQVGPYEVRVENWPDRALGTAREFHPDLILMDVIMPHVPGLELAASMHTDAELSRTPIVFLTATVSRGDEPSADRVRTSPCIAKPASIDEVIDGIEGNLTGKVRPCQTTGRVSSIPPPWNRDNSHGAETKQAQAGSGL